MSNQEETAFNFLQQNKNANTVINDTDKKVSPACTDKEDAIKESKNQHYEKKMYTQLTQEADQLI